MLSKWINIELFAVIIENADGKHIWLIGFNRAGSNGFSVTDVCPAQPSRKALLRKRERPAETRRAAACTQPKVQRISSAEGSADDQQ